VDRTTNGTGAVSELTLEELRGLDAGVGERIPTLDEVIDVADREIGVNVELKGLGTAGPVHEVIERAISGKGWSRDGFIVSSFHLGELVAIRELSDQVRTGVLFARDRGGILEFAELNRAYSIHPYFGDVDAELIGEACDRGLRTFVWTVNDPADVSEMKSLGVDGIISDYPDRV
jgi:glycerophosphoryl diester phosphodiesterase